MAVLEWQPSEVAEARAGGRRPSLACDSARRIRSARQPPGERDVSLAVAIRPRFLLGYDSADRAYTGRRTRGRTPESVIGKAKVWSCRAARFVAGSRR